MRVWKPKEIKELIAPDSLIQLEHDFKITTKEFLTLARKTMPTAALMTACGALHSRQTDDEKRYHKTIQRNGIGFSKTDAKKISEIYQWWLEKRFLTVKQEWRVRVTLRKYSKQLAEIATLRSTQKTSQPHS